MVEESENPTFDSLTPEQQEWVEGRANLRAAIDAMKTGRPTRAIEAGEIIVSLTETEKQLNKPFFDMVEQVRNDPDNPSFSGLPREVRGFAINGIYTGGIEMAEDAITAGRIEPVLKEAAYLALFGKGYIPYTIAHRAIQRYLPEPAANTASNTLLGGIAGPKGMLAAGTATAIYEILRPMGATAETVETAEQLPPDVREDLIAATYGLHRLADGRLVHDPVADSYYSTNIEQAGNRHSSLASDVATAAVLRVGLSPAVSGVRACLGQIQKGGQTVAQTAASGARACLGQIRKGGQAVGQFFGATPAHAGNRSSGKGQGKKPKTNTQNPQGTALVNNNVSHEQLAKRFVKQTRTPGQGAVDAVYQDSRVSGELQAIHDNHLTGGKHSVQKRAEGLFDRLYAISRDTLNEVINKGDLIKHLRDGIYELRDHGNPPLRIYLARHDNSFIALFPTAKPLNGNKATIKQLQNADIDTALGRWTEHLRALRIPQETTSKRVGDSISK